MIMCWVYDSCHMNDFCVVLDVIRVIAGTRLAICAINVVFGFIVLCNVHNFLRVS